MPPRLLRRRIDRQQQLPEGRVKMESDFSSHAQEREILRIASALPSAGASSVYAGDVQSRLDAVIAAGALLVCTSGDYAPFGVARPVVREFQSVADLKQRTVTVITNPGGSNTRRGGANLPQAKVVANHATIFDEVLRDHADAMIRGGRDHCVAAGASGPVFRKPRQAAAVRRDGLAAAEAGGERLCGRPLCRGGRP